MVLANLAPFSELLGLDHRSRHRTPLHNICAHAVGGARLPAGHVTLTTPLNVAAVLEMAAELRCESVGDLGEGARILRCRDLARKLESSVFNSVSLGEWEAARASLACLAADPASRENAKELLKILVVEPANFW